MRVGCTAIAVAVASLTLAGATQAQTTLRYQFKEGEKLEYVFDQNQKTSMTVNGMDIEFKTRIAMEIAWQTLKVGDRGKAQAKVTVTRVKMTMKGGPFGKIEVDSTDTNEPDGALGKIFANAVKAMGGMEMTLTTDTLGEITDVKIAETSQKKIKKLQGGGATGLFNSDSLKQLVEGNILVPLPRDPVSRGKSWTQKVNMKSPGGKMTGERKFTYEGETDRNLQRLAVKPDMKYEADAKAPVRMKLKSSSGKGVTLFDNKVGRVAQTTDEGTMEMEVEAGGQTTSTTTRQTTTVRLKAGKTPEKASEPTPAKEKESGPREPRGSRPPAGRPAGDHAAPPAEGKTALKFTALERNEPFYQVVETETRQTIKATGKVVVRKQKQTLYVRWTPLGKKGGNYQLRQRIIGLKLTIDTGGKTTTYDSTAPESKQTQDQTTDFFKALPKQEMVFTVSPALEVVGVDGRTQFIKGLSEAIPAVKSSLDTMLSEKPVKRMAESLWSALPPQPVAVGETWKKASELDLGPLGAYTTTFTCTLQGVQGGQARIRTEASLTYKAPKDGTGLPYVIKKSELTGQGGTGEAVFNVKRGRFDSIRTSTKLHGSFSILVGNATTALSIEQEQSATARCRDTNPLVQEGK
jgi:hypothetical protein